MPDGCRCSVDYVWACCLKLCFKAAEQCRVYAEPRAHSRFSSLEQPKVESTRQECGRLATCCYQRNIKINFCEILLAAFSEIDFGNLTTLGVDHVICNSFCFSSDGVLSYMWHHVHSYSHSVSQCIIRTLVEGLFKRACIHIPKEKSLNSCVFFRSSSFEHHVFGWVCHPWVLELCTVAICWLKLWRTKRPLEGGHYCRI